MTGGLLAIDPGVTEFGWALWKTVRTRVRPPTAAGVISAFTERSSWDARLKALTSILYGALPHTDISRVVFEFPQTFAGKAGTAASAKGDTLKLAAFCGYVAASMHEIHGSSFEFIEVHEWKGTLKKTVTKDRIRRAVGDCDRRGDKISSHAWDAVGVGLHAMGFTIDGPEIARRYK